jgi:imidazolonepropionase-like amidohydrolase
MDLHSHILLHPYNETSWDDQVLKEPVEYRVLLAGRHANAQLQSGFTTLRDLGSEGAGYADAAIKRAIDEGVIPGPRLFVATRAIVASSSYGPNVKAYRLDMELPGGAQEATGVDEVVKAVREQSFRGADWIKVYADYRTGPDNSAHATFSQDELNALVRTAHESGRKVAFHASTDEGMRRSVLAGAGSHQRIRPEACAWRCPHAVHAGGSARLPAGAQAGRDDRPGQRCRRVCPRQQRA